jgi:hypothetical protein
MRHVLLHCIVLTAIAHDAIAGTIDSQQAGSEPARAIIRLAADVYRVQAGAEATVFVVGADGILIADPLDLATAQWLKPELESRFPNRPVLYIVEASPSLIRVGGGAIFKPLASTIGHEGYTRELLRALKGAPPAAPKYVTYPKEFFSTGKTVTLGGKTVRIINSGSAYRADSSVLLFVEDRVLFTWSRRLGAEPFSFSGGDTRETVNLVRTIAPLQFDTLVTSNGQTLQRRDVDRLIKYLDYLGAETAAGIKSGRSVNQMLTRPVPVEFRNDRHASERTTQLGALYNAARVRWTDLQGAAVYSWFDKNSEYCGSAFRCESGAQVVGGTGGLRIGTRRFGAIAEMTVTQQFLSLRDDGRVNEVFAHRQTRGSLLLSFGGTRLRGPSFNVLAGLTTIVGDSDGVSRREALAPIGGRRAVNQRSHAFGVTVGTDLAFPMGNRISLVLPLRATMIDSPPQVLWPGRFDAQGGVGFRLNLLRSVH